MYTVQSGLRQLSQSSLDEPNLVMAGVIIAVLPIVIVLLSSSASSCAGSRPAR